MKYLTLSLFVLTLLIALVSAAPTDSKPHSNGHYDYHPHHKSHPYKSHPYHKREAEPETLAKSDSAGVAAAGDYYHHDHGYGDYHGHDGDYGDYHDHDHGHY
ncbi:hypothetical protein RclHR1_00370011 [Rhizophagus clarus]|uniref:Uncharacterized protein n=1 Tax=Rhizophagus clarus TaxID=94130 RepID=A0A2Z6RDC5_9GLOM|nr:hypothetical protein RclHR1_00370011 [Rhizophagus clarus]GET03562.1 hypothetical protein RCL_jg22524.t1 [Rhizophagus clarus]